MGSGLRRNVGANAVNVAVALAAGIAASPLVIHYVGIAGFGVWTIAQTVLLYVTAAEAGFGPAIQRFTAVARGRAADDEVARLLWTTLGLYLVAGALLALGAHLLADPAARAFDLPHALEDDASTTFSRMGIAIPIALLAAGLGNVQQGLERFGAFALSSAAGALAFLGMAALLLDAGHGLPGLATAAIVAQGVLTVTRLYDLRALIATRPGGVGREATGELVSFSARLQVTAISSLVNNQTDRVVAGFLASAATVGQLGIGTQVSDGARLLGGAALSPLVSRLGVVHGSGDAERLALEHARLRRLWNAALVGMTVILLAALPGAIRAWLGEGHGKAVVFAALLVAASAATLATGPNVAYLRATGRPGLEARYGTAVMAVNVVATVALGIAAGAIGIVVATLIAQAAGAAWFLRRSAALLPPETAAAGLGIEPVLLLRALICAAVAGAGALAAALALPAGIALAPAGAAILLATWVFARAAGLLSR
jgi:O-antigen/teichoic acid export membrane protein